MAWRFAPIGVLSHCERDHLNICQLLAFAECFDLPVYRWRLPTTPEYLGLVEDGDPNGILDAEPAAFGWFCEGFPILLANTIRSTRKLVNGTPGLLDSLAFKDDVVPAAVSAAGGHWTGGPIDIEPPYAVNVRVSGGLWHGVRLDDLSSLVQSVGASATDVVIPLLMRDEEEMIDLYTVRAAMNGLPGKLGVTSHGYLLAAALTDFKLQGRTLPRLLLSFGKRPQSPFITMNVFYVLVSRVMGFDGLRLLDWDPEQMAKLHTLSWGNELAAWEAGFEEGGIACAWAESRVRTWLDGKREERTAAAAAAAAGKAMDAAASKPLDKRLLGELQELCRIAELDTHGRKADLIGRLCRLGDHKLDLAKVAQAEQLRSKVESDALARAHTDAEAHERAHTRALADAKTRADAEVRARQTAAHQADGVGARPLAKAQTCTAAAAPLRPTAQLARSLVRRVR